MSAATWIALGFALVVIAAVATLALRAEKKERERVNALSDSEYEQEWRDRQW